MTLARAVVKKYLLGCIAGWIAVLLPLHQGLAQIQSATADHVDTLGYLPGNTDLDPLFVFYQSGGVSKTGELTALPPSPGNYNFEWSRYNPALPGFDPPFSSEAALPSSTVTNLGDGGYLVRIWNGTGTDISFTSWVMLDELRDSVVQTADGNLPGYLFTCDFIAVSGYIFPDTLVYYDLQTHEQITRPLDFSFKWTSDNPDLDIPNDTIVLRPNISYKPPYRDTEYTLTATDEFGMTEQDHVLYASIQTKAEFVPMYYDKVNREFVTDLDEAWSKDQGSMDAELTVQFINHSLNGASYEWVYLDTLGGVPEKEFTYELEPPTEFTYIAADKYYYPYLVSTSEEFCTDTFRLEGAIHVVRSQLEIPNVFTPNGDPDNDRFIFKHQSLKSCKVTIVDRTGKVVYQKKIDDIYAWEGWDGNLHDSNRKAPEGQYYYVVEATGYDGAEFSDPTIIEQWKLNRGNKGTDGTTDGTGSTSQTLYTGWLYLFR
jgi:gliding motility-associated-like protein